MFFFYFFFIFLFASGLLRNWITWTFGRDIRSLSTPVCKGHTFLVYVSIYVSTWLLVIMTLERTCSACMPTRISSLCTRRRAYFTIVFIVIFHCGLHFHFLILMTVKRSDMMILNSTNVSGYEVTVWENVHSGNFELTTVMTSISGVYGGSYICDGGTKEYHHYIHHIWPMLDVFLLSVIPSILVLIGNLIIVWKAKVSLWTAEELNAATNSRARRKRFSSMTVMLGLISIVFILTSLPTCLYNLWERSSKAKTMSQTTKGAAKVELMWAFVNLVMYCNNTFNFYLYLLSGRKFRKAVSRQLSRRRTESQSNALSGYSFQLQARFNQPQEARNGHAVPKGQSGSLHRKFQMNQPSRKQSSIKYKPCSMSNHSNAYL